MSFTTHNELPGTRTTGSRRGLHWIIVAVGVLGYMACALIASSILQVRHSGLVVAVGAFVALPAAFVLIFALRQAWAYAREFVPTLSWWHVLWGLTILSALVFRRRSTYQITSNPLDAWAAYRVALDTIVAFALLARLALRRTHWLGSMFRGLVGILAVYGLVCLASIFWSVYPAWTLFKSWEYLVDIALLAAVLETLDSVDAYRNFLNWNWALCALLLLSVAKDLLLWPHDALYEEAVLANAPLSIRLSGVIPALSSNDVSTFAGILAVISLARLFPASRNEQYKRSWYIFLFLISMAAVVLSQTRTALFGIALGAFFVLLFSRRGKLLAFFSLVMVPIIAILAKGGLILSFIERGQTAAQMDSLSSRTEWWGLAWRAFLEQPFTGFGAYAAGRFEVLSKGGFALTGTMHSDYLEVLVGTGLWGLVPLLAVLAAAWWFLLRYIRHSPETQERQLVHECLAVLALLTFRSFFNNMMTIHPAFSFLAVVGCVEFVRRRREAASPYGVPYLTGMLFTQDGAAAEPFATSGD